MYVFDVMIKEETLDEGQIKTEEYSPQSLKALSSVKCQEIIRVLRNPHEWVEYSEMVQKHQGKQEISRQCQEQANLTSLPTISEIKSELIWELDADPIRLQHEPNEQCGRNQTQPESISGKDEMELDSAVKADEIIHITNDHTYVDAQADSKYGYTVDQLNPDDTIQEEPPQHLVADCRVLLIKHMPPVWHINKIRQFVIENTSATQEDIIDIFIYSTETNINRGQFLFEFKSPRICHQVFKEFMQFAKQKLYTMRAEYDIGHQKLNYKLKDIQLRPTSKSAQIHQQVNNDTYGLSLSYLENLGIQPPLSPTVFVSQLSMYVDDELVRQIFSIAGQIKFFSFRVISLADITAEIEYDHPVEAVQAVAMFDKQKIYDRVISVKLVQRNAHTFKLPRGLVTVGPGLGPNGAPLRGVRAVMELQPVKDILHDIKFALRNVHMDSHNSYFDKPVQIRKEADIVAPSTNDYSNTEQQNTHSHSFTHGTIVNIEQQSTLSSSTANIEQQNAHSSSIANTEQQNAHSSIIANTEQQNTPSTSTTNIELQNTLSTSNAIAHPSVLLELANTLKDLINTLQKNNLVNTNVTPNITQENVSQKRSSSNPIQSQNENSQNANLGPEPAKKPKGKLGQQLPDSSSTMSVQHPSTSREACRSQDCNPNVARYNFQHHRNLAQNIILPNNNAPFIPNGHNVVRFDMIGSMLNSNQFGFNMGHNARSNVHNVPPHVPHSISRNIPNGSQNPETSQLNVAQNKPNMSQNSPVYRTNSLRGNLNQKNTNTPEERRNTNIDQHAPVRNSESPVEIVNTNVNQNPSANQNMYQIPPNINQNVHESTPNTNPSDVSQIKTQNAYNVYPNSNTSDTNKNDILCSRNYPSSGPSTSQITQNILGSDQNPAMPTSPPTPPAPQITNLSSISRSEMNTSLELQSSTVRRKVRIKKKRSGKKEDAGEQNYY
ncbi:uncharacterized protein LOC113234651 isoform X2 [Hyposmocoma kahamanoa]|uniref:uncharacterized protein LOC113234651 isoform X2 n=1 Tax=Hyposmocoma kahamanoa TaxID=1477025 RepID=UPI000E6D8645|nr:uncharacterized protein LOC113234651 isoform X2 [Hyposmocoma kahamanoa]